MNYWLGKNPTKLGAQPGSLLKKKKSLAKVCRNVCGAAQKKEINWILFAKTIHQSKYN